MGYTSERNNQIVVELLKQHNISKVVVSPGATNVSIVASLQCDDFFDLYSSVDERSAAYLACGIAEESGEAVALSCTGATASRNYLPGLTEAFYRKLPILAITSTMPVNRLGHNIPQMIDRSCPPVDSVKGSYYIPMVTDKEDEWSIVDKVNEAILELCHNCKGPVLLNVETMQGGSFDVSSIDNVRVINRITKYDVFPEIQHLKVAVFVGAHSKWNDKLTKSVDSFCENNNAIVIGDHTSNYKGKYFVPSSLIVNQRNRKSQFSKFDLLIHIGDVSGAYLDIFPHEVWRVNEDGKICDTFRKLRYVFEMNEEEFFGHYSGKEKVINEELFREWSKEYDGLFKRIPELPFSNVWIAQKMSSKIPAKSILYLGILNCLRSWNYFKIPNTVCTYCNTGGFGIDGEISSAIGVSFATNEKVFCITGDLGFFYDINSIGNRDIKSNLRIMLINNGHGQEFKIYGHRASQFGEETEKYISAKGHFGNKSRNLVKNFAENMGFMYFTADSKENFENVYLKFVAEEDYEFPVIFEVFTNSDEETQSSKLINGINGEVPFDLKKQVKDALGERKVKIIKDVINEVGHGHKK